MRHAPLLILLILLTGCTAQQALPAEKPGGASLRAGEATPYISRIEPENLELRRLAASVTSGCPSGDRECQISMLYRYMVENYTYYSDPRSRELIQSPSETIYIKGGDCEDLTILLISLLENIGIKTYFVMTEDHAYALACGVDPEKLWKYVKESLVLQASRDLAGRGDTEVKLINGEVFLVSSEEQSVLLKSGEVYYYGGNGSTFSAPVRYMNIEYQLTSTLPVDIYVVPSDADFRALSERRAYTHYPECSKRGVLSLRGRCEGLRRYGGIVIASTGSGDAEVRVKLKFYFSYDTRELLRNAEVSYYTIGGETCVPLDPTAGRYGYPGYEAESTPGRAYDPLTGESVALGG